MHRNLVESAAASGITYIANVGSCNKAIDDAILSRAIAASTTDALCKQSCTDNYKCTGYEFHTDGTQLCQLFYGDPLTADGVTNVNYDCQIKYDAVAVANAAWYADTWTNWVKVYLFELCKIYGGYLEAYILKFGLKYGMQFLTGHDF